jgi:endonuclease YncB( thermonuclease family)
MKSKLPLDPDRHKHSTQRLKDKKSFLAFVISVCDGDTIQIARHCDGECYSDTDFVRLAGIDAPELRGFDARAALWSQEYLQRLIGHRLVIVTPRRIWRDPYHRIIASVTIDRQDVCTCLIRDGHAVERKNRR